MGKTREGFWVPPDHVPLPVSLLVLQGHPSKYSAPSFIFVTLRYSVLLIMMSSDNCLFLYQLCATLIVCKFFASLVHYSCEFPGITMSYCFPFWLECWFVSVFPSPSCVLLSGRPPRSQQVACPTQLTLYNFLFTDCCLQIHGWAFPISLEVKLAQTLGVER